MNITHRDEIGTLLNELRLFGDGAEVGCADGKFSRVILDKWKGNGNLYLIDPLTVLPDYHEAESNTEYRNQICRDSIQALVKADRRAIWFPVTSEKAIRMLADESFDFVYIDSNHDYEHSRTDLAGWYGIVRPGGLFCGHDFYNLVVPPDRNCRVLDAMNEFLKLHPYLKLHSTPSCTSWWIQKPRI